ncbi:helix-turn-helix domain-containing protein [Streptomyces sp. NPDC056519]|uniref:helix-turn-helix domain-containing protein n=1 Tax=Streptomyces sp. NPDC056519 TaxID=3345849 RepID=UPI0036C52271
MGVGGRLYSWCVRYADGGGLTPTGRQRREMVRMQAAELFERKIKPSEVVRRLRMSMKSACQWHQLWRDGGVQALASRGPSGSRRRLSPRCLEKLAMYLEEGPAAHGWVCQRSLKSGSGSLSVPGPRRVTKAAIMKPRDRRAPPPRPLVPPRR